MKKIVRNNRGFSLAEMILVVAIIVILAGVSFVAVLRYQRNLNQVEKDGIAKELFIAAQNHLSAAESQGYLGAEASAFGTAELDAEGNPTGVYYFVVGTASRGGADPSADDGESLLSMMLPFASIDETVRQGGSYVIRYQTDPALVLDVFYAKPGERFGHSFTESEYEKLVESYRGSDEAVRKSRRFYNATDDNSVIGWYGGEGAARLTLSSELNAPSLSYENAARLRFFVTDGEADSHGLRLVLHGESSGRDAWIDLIGGSLHYTAADGSEVSTYLPSGVVVSDGADGYTVTLDDVTAAGRHFRDLLGAETAGFIPGENLSVYACAYETGLGAAASGFEGPSSNTVFTNSLFGDGSSETDAEIANIRHLENLDTRVSRLDEGDGANALNVAAAHQTADLSWPQFLSEIGGQVTVTGAGNGGLTDPGCYFPVNWPSSVEQSEGLSYDGGGHSVSGVVVRSGSPSGLFGELEGASVRDLELVDFDISCTNGANAGALAGNLLGGTVSGVLVRNSGDDSALQISAANGNAGGLIGAMAPDSAGGAPTVEQCAAAVYVRSANGSAGGLIGSAARGAVSGSYAGGHTQDGAYLDLTTDGAAARVNVIAPNGSAGGLVGLSSAVNYTTVYSTASAAGGTAAGGLLGSSGADVVTNAYAVSRVVGMDGGASVGAVVGAVGALDSSLSGVRYYEIINEGLRPVGGVDAASGVTALDENLETYNRFITPHTLSAGGTLEAAAALPYDSGLKAEFKDAWNMPGVNQLGYIPADGEDVNTVGALLREKHYGDWPSPETKVVNTHRITAGGANGENLSANVGSVSVVYDENAGFPAGVSLSAVALDAERQDYRDYLAAALATVGAEAGDLRGAEVLDLSVLLDGAEVQPGAAVDVELALDGALLEGNVRVVHFGVRPETLTARRAGDTLTFRATGFSVYAVVRTTLERTLTASDGSEYRVSVSFGEDSGVPKDAELRVAELGPDDPDYADYVRASMKRVGASADSVLFARAFDISLRNARTGETYQPLRDVEVSIELLRESLEEAGAVDVVHFHGEDGSLSELVSGSVVGESVAFTAESFSVYVVIGHEGGEIVTPRVEFHFLSQDFTEDAENPGSYSATPFYFPNKSAVNNDKDENGLYFKDNDAYQNSEIVKSGETLEIILNPPNIEFTEPDPLDPENTVTVSKYFFGWYLVESTLQASDGTVSYIWTADPEKIAFELPVTIDPNKVVWANDEHTAITSFVWELNGVEHSVSTEDNTGTKLALDEFGCAHVYLAPIYQDYYFVNFHAGDEGSDLGNSLIARRLVVLGSDGEAEIRIGDVVASGTDSKHRIFTGWEGLLWDEASAETAKQQMTTLDEVGEEYNSGEDKDGFYITVGSHDLYEGKMSVDLYPIYTEARWLHFRTGGEGATYVGDTYVYTTDEPSQVENGTARYFLTDLKTSSRTGYRFKGWFADATTLDSNGDYIDGQQITDENGSIVTGSFTKYAADGVTPIYQIENGRFYAYKALDADQGVTLYAHWEEEKDAYIQIIIWRQKISDDKNAYDMDKNYDFEASYSVETSSGMTLADLRANGLLTNYEDKGRYVSNVDGSADFTGFHYRTTEMNTATTRGDGSTVVNVYYDRDLMTLYFYYSYSGEGEPAYNYTETTADNPEEQYGIVEGEYVRLTRKQGSGMKYTFRYNYQQTTSDTILPQYALISYSGGVKLYEELTREVETVSRTRWSFQTGKGRQKTTRYMDQNGTDGHFYVGRDYNFWTGSYNYYVDSGYTVDDPPPANNGTTYYCYYNYRYYKLTPQTTTTTTYTWKYGDSVWTGARYRRLAGTEEYRDTLYTVSGSSDTFGKDSRGGYVELDGTSVNAYQWYTTVHTEGYYLDNDNDGSQQDVYGLVGDDYVLLTPILGDTYTYSTERTYVSTTQTYEQNPQQYALIQGEYVELDWETVETVTGWAIDYTYTPTTSTSNGNYYLYTRGTGYNSGYSFRSTTLYYHNGKWYRTRSGWYGNYSYSDEWTGGVYERTTGTGVYTGTVYGMTNDGGFTNYSSGTRYGDGGSGVIYQLGNQTQTNRDGWVLDQVEYTGTRYRTESGAVWTGNRYTRAGTAAPYTYQLFTDSPAAGQSLYIEDGNVGDSGDTLHGHVKLKWSVAVTGYTYEDGDGVQQPYTGDRYSFGVQDTETLYTGKRFTRAARTDSYNKMLMYTGLYGQTLEQAGYTWPDKIGTTSYTWYSQTSGGSRLTFLDAFLFKDLEYATNNNTVLTVYGTKTSQSGTYICFYKQNLDGSYPALGSDTATNAIATGSSGTFTFTNKYNGFEVRQYSTNNGSSWSNAAVNGSTRYSSSGLHIRFERQKYELIFDPNYPKAAGTTIEGTELTLDNMGDFVAANTVTEMVLFEAPLSAYKNQPQPVQGPDNYVFTGWYVDEGCTVAYKFNEIMPSANMRLYAGWSPVRFRVKIDPNGGEIDHINHKWDNESPTLSLRGYADSGAGWWWVDDGQGGRTAVQYAPSEYDSETWTPFDNFSRDEILAPDGTVERAADTGWAATSRYSTYINAYYMATISEYTNLKREYVPVSDAFAETYDGAIYYYMNAQYQSEAIDGSGLPSANRSALYLTESELHEYYLFYKNWVEANLVGGYITGTTVLDEETWRETYVSKQKYRHTLGSESYTFLGWYKLDANGNPESMPYNFSDPVTGELSLRAYWRLDAGYQIRYHADYEMDDGTIVNGSIPYWTDPEIETSRYADEAATHIYRQPTGITANGIETDDYIFQGWRLVNLSTNSQGQVVYQPIEDGVYYDPGDDFTVHAAYADRTSVIHMQAVYQEKDSSYRRPYVTNLTLNANGGFITLDGENELNLNTDLSSTWDGVFGTVAATVTTDTGDTELIEFGDIQSGEKVRLYRYATDLTHVDGDESKPELDPAGQNYFKHPDNYFLLGFDDESDEGDYVATYPADSVVAVQRNEQQTKYAVWEPLVYIKFVNETGVGPVTFSLSSSEGALQVVNARESLYERTPMSQEDLSHITVEAGDYVWLAVPYGVVKQVVNGEETWVKRHITVNGTNTLGPGYLLSARSELNGELRETFTGALTGTNEDYISVQNRKPFGFNEVLEIDPEGIVVTFTALLNPHTLVLDDNDPTPNLHYHEVYFDHQDSGLITYGQQQQTSYELTSTNSRPGYQFRGWDPDPDWAENHDLATEKPMYSTGSAAGWTIADLNEFFSDGAGDYVSVRTLYAVWDDSAEAKKVYIVKEVPDPGDQTKEFTFTVALSGTYAYQQYSSWRWNTKSGSFTATGTGTVTLKHGEYFLIESEQNLGSSSVKPYIRATIVKYDADGAELSRNTLSWQWSNYNDNNSYIFNSFTPTYSVTETDYTSAYYDTTMTRTSQTPDYPLKLAGSSDTSSKPLTVEGRVVSWDNTEAGGTVVFNNIRQTRTVTLKKALNNGSGLAGIFDFTASYQLDGVTTNLGTLHVTSGTTGVDLEHIPVGAQLTITERGTGLNDYVTTAARDGAALTVSAGSETSGTTTTLLRTVGFTLQNADTVVTYTNTLKSFPITFYKVDQDGNAGVPSYFRISSATGLIAEQLYPSQTGTGEFFPGTSGRSNEFYVGSYTLTETFVGSSYLPLDGPVTFTLSADEGGSLSSSNTDYVKIEEVRAGHPEQGFRVYVYTQKIVKLKIAKVLSDPTLSTTKSFSFRVQYTYELLGRTVSYDNDGSLLTVRSGSSAEILVPVNASLTVTEMLSATELETYDTTVTRATAAGSADAAVQGTSYSYGSGAGANHTVVSAANEGDVLTFTNTRKTVEVTVKKLVADVPADGDVSYTFTATLLNGGIGIKGYAIDRDDPAGDGLTDATDQSAGRYVFYLKHGEEKTLTIPIGARLKLQETGASSTDAHTEDIPIANYTASVEALFNDDGSAYTRGSYTDSSLLYDMNPVPGKALTVTFTNARRTQPVTVEKLLDDVYLASGETRSFHFTATLKDGETPVNFPGSDPASDTLSFDYTMNADGIVGEFRTLRIPLGCTLTVVETPDADYITTVDGAETGTAAFTASSEEPATVQFTNTRRTADLQIIKLLVDPYNSANGSFGFAASAVLNGNALSLDMNKFTLTSARDAGSATARTITVPLGTTVTVEELLSDEEAAKYTTVTSAGACAEAEWIENEVDLGLRRGVSLTVSADTTLSFTNTRNTKTVTVRKTLNDAWNGGAQFTFTAAAKDGTASLSLAAADAAFTLGRNGTHALTVPVGASLTVTETGVPAGSAVELAWYDTEFTWHDTEADEDDGAGSGTTAELNKVAADHTLTFTNTRRTVDVTVVKVLNDPVSAITLFSFNYSLNGGAARSFTVDSANSAGTTLTGETVVFPVGGSLTVTETLKPKQETYFSTLALTNVGTATYHPENRSLSFEQLPDAAGGVTVTFTNNRQWVDVTLNKTRINDHGIGSGTFTYHPVVTELDPDTGAPLRSANLSDVTVTMNADDTGTTIFQAPIGMKLVLTEQVGDEYIVTSSGVRGTGSGAVYTVNEMTADGDTIHYTNERKTVTVTIKKTLIEEKPELSTDSFRFSVKVLTGHDLDTAAPIQNYTVFGSGDAAWTTDAHGEVRMPNGELFTLTHDASQDVTIPVGASVTVQEVLTAAQSEKYAAFIVIPGGSENLLSGTSHAFKLEAPTENTTIRVFNIPSICKVTDDKGELLYVLQEGGATPEDPSDDIYIPAIFPTIKGAFEGRTVTQNEQTLTVGGLGNYYHKNQTEKYSALSKHRIEMLVDYEVPKTDVVVVNAGFDMVFTTADRNATDGYPFRSARPTPLAPPGVPDSSNDYRAVLKRASDCEKAFFTVNPEKTPAITTFLISDLIIDGDGVTLESGVRGGCLTAFESDVSIENCIIYRFVADQGGAVFTTGDTLNVKDVIFDSCKSGLENNGNGGGAINTTANSLSITASEGNTNIFRNCTAVWQGGAVYQYGAYFDKNGLVHVDATGGTKTMVLEHCLFEDCVSRSGGGVQADVNSVTVSDCDFVRCVATSLGSGGNGGGLNNFTNDFTNDSNKGGTLTVTNCSFEGCYSLDGDGYGGGLRSIAGSATLRNCDFKDSSHTEVDSETQTVVTVVDHCQAKYGGGAAFTNAKGTAALYGCTFTGCESIIVVKGEVGEQTAAGGQGGAIYSAAKSLTLGADGDTQTSISGCKSNGASYVYTKDGEQVNGHINGCGGGVYGKNSSVTIQDETTISSCQAEASTGYGGGVYLNGGGLSMSGGTISENTAKNGGGVFATGGSVNITLNGGKINENRAAFSGGGVRLEAGAKLTLNSGEINGNQTSSSGEVYAGGISIKNGTVTIAGGSVSNNSVKSTGKLAQGGGIYLDTGTLTVTGGEISGNTAETTKAGAAIVGQGGAVFVKGGATMNLSGGTISGNTAKAQTAGNAQGAGIYVAYNVDKNNVVTHGTLNLSGDPGFGGGDTDDEGAFSATAGNLLTTDPSGTNGGLAYTQARQDIYLAGYAGEDAPSIRVTGALTGGKGDIWVWAAEDPHYIKDQQFAVVDDELSDPGNLAVFRDARVDTDTLATTAPLYGIPDRNNAKRVIWGTVGGSEILFTKVDSEGNALAGATFALYTDAACTVPYPSAGDQFTGTSNAEGVVRIGPVPIGTYYMKETAAPTGYSLRPDVYTVTIEPDVKINGTDVVEASDYKIVNDLTQTRKVILKKINPAYDALEGAEFALCRSDGSVVATFTVSASHYGASGINGAFYVGNLPIGTYYLHETKSPTTYGNPEGKAYMPITVTAEGVTVGTWQAEVGTT
ncbi:MAG: InlB B-repeat-containing protein [Oscillospiraceae bacterium]|nr:InlB B-repeat-containing protein [Oscillospiraceae bacterium]